MESLWDTESFGSEMLSNKTDSDSSVEEIVLFR